MFLFLILILGMFLIMKNFNPNPSLNINVAHLLLPSECAVKNIDNKSLVTDKNLTLSELKDVPKEVTRSKFLSTVATSRLKPKHLILKNPYCKHNPYYEYPEEDLKYNEYWQWDITLPPLDLTKFDLLIMTPHWDFFVPEYYKERLKTFVEEGGVLWVDNCDKLKLHNFFFKIDTTAILKKEKYICWTDEVDHPLLNNYFKLNPEEIKKFGSNIYLTLYYDEKLWDIIIYFKDLTTGKFYPAVMTAEFGKGIVIFSNNHIDFWVDGEEKFIAEKFFYNICYWIKRRNKENVK